MIEDNGMVWIIGFIILGLVVAFALWRGRDIDIIANKIGRFRTSSKPQKDTQNIKINIGTGMIVEKEGTVGNVEGGTIETSQTAKSQNIEASILDKAKIGKGAKVGDLKGPTIKKG